MHPVEYEADIDPYIDFDEVDWVQADELPLTVD